MFCLFTPLGAALGWGSGDFLSKKLCESDSPADYLFLLNLPGGLFWPFVKDFLGTLPIALAMALGNAGFHALLGTQEVARAVPLSASYVWVAALLGVLVGGERVEPLIWGIPIFLGIVLLLTERWEWPSTSALGPLLLTILGWGIGTFLLGSIKLPTSDIIGGMSFWLVLFGLLLGSKRSSQPGWGVAAGTAILVARISYVLATRACPFLPVLFISSAYPVVAAALGLLHGERLKPRHYLGILLVLGGILGLGWELA